jgi:hypothetical protein
MKKLVSSIVIVAALFCLNSCKELCEKNNTGDLTIFNNTSIPVVFDIEASGATFDYRTVPAGGSTTYTIPSGYVTVNAAMNTSSDFYEVAYIKLARCAEETYSSPTQICSMFDLTQVTIINNTSWNLYFKLWISGVGDLNQVFIYSGSSYTYTNVPVGNGSATCDVYYEGSWLWGNFFTVEVCGTHSCEWEDKKVIEVSESQQELVIKEK